MSSLLQLIIPRGWWRGLRLPTGPGVRFVVCHGCRTRHLLDARDPLDPQIRLFEAKHFAPSCRLELFKIRNPDAYGELLAFAGNADVKEAFNTSASLTITNLNSLASSTTAGWQGAGIDNNTDTSVRFLDDLWQVVFAAVNTAPANLKVFFILCGYSLDGGTNWTRPFTGSEGTVTYDDIATLPQCAEVVDVVPYATQNTAIKSKSMSVAQVTGFVLPPRYAPGVINNSGMTIAASGNVFTSQRQYRTVA